MTEAAAPAAPVPAAPLLRNWRRADWPTDWDVHLPGRGGLHLEIGFGDGRYTARRALAEPEGRFVGIELSGVSTLRALRRLHRDAIGNVVLFKGNATLLLRQLFGEKSIATITVNFPDPWPKGRHGDNRLLQESFYRLAASRLEPGGSILLATDDTDYLEFARQQARLTGLYRLEDREPPAAVFETKYALKWKDRGKTLHYQPFILGRNAPEGFSPPLERPHTMPHSLLAGQLPRPAGFSKRVSTHADGHVILHEAASSIGDRGRLLVRATVQDPLLVQQLLVVVQERKPGELIVRLESFGDPVITDTVRGAVHAVTQWLLEQPGVSLKERHY